MTSTNGTTRRGRIPIPVSVSLRNLCPNASEAQVQSQSKKWFRPEHSMSLLHHVLLEILIVPSDEEKESGEKERIIFSSLAPVRTVNPSWSHLEECIEDYLAIDGYVDSETGSYRFMRLQIWLLSDADGEKDVSLRKNGQDPLLDISIHPTKLRRLAAIPQQLPVNSLIFHFSDGSIRATKSLLDIIGDQDGLHADVHNKDEFGRFGDDVFRTLDSVTPVKKTKNDAAEESSLNKTSSDDSEDGDGVGSSSICDKRQQQELLASVPNKFPPGEESDAHGKDANAERRRLEMLIQMEEEALERDLLVVQEGKVETEALLEQSSKYETDLANLKEGIKNEKQLCRQAEFYLEARRIKLLLDLRQIYPITWQNGDDRFLIRDLCIPSDVHSGAVTEEELSAALGFLCHLISLVSRYTSVVLRHRVFCNSSRSAIQEEGGSIFPLFLARVVERDQLDQGLLLLRRNVECILKTRDVEYQPRDHILVNVRRFFDVMTNRME